jgi:choline-sulfatase
MVDQLSGTFFPDGGPADFLHAPHLKALAARSARFANAYTTSPLCLPARASLAAGQMPSRTRLRQRGRVRGGHSHVRPSPS